MKNPNKGFYSIGKQSKMHGRYLLYLPKSNSISPVRILTFRERCNYPLMKTIPFVTHGDEPSSQQKTNNRGCLPSYIDCLSFQAGYFKIYLSGALNELDLIGISIQYRMPVFPCTFLTVVSVFRSTASRKKSLR